MTPRQQAFLQAVLGEPATQALQRACEQQPELSTALLPRAVLAWTDAASLQGWDGLLPGLDIRVRLQKTDTGLSGQIDSISFQAVPVTEVAATLAVALDLDLLPVPEGIRGPQLQRLGKALDQMTRYQMEKRVLDPSLGYQLQHRHSEPMGDSRLTHVSAHTPDGKQVGAAMFRHTLNGGLQPASVVVDEAHQRRGLATAMYQRAEAATGKKIIPSSVQTEEGAALWQQPGRPFGGSQEGPVKAPAAPPSPPAAKAEPPGQAAAPTAPGAPQEAVRPQKAPRPRIPSLKIGKSQLDIRCVVCDQTQFSSGKFTGCLCFQGLAKSVHQSAYGDGLVLTFDPGIWDLDTILALQATLGGR